MQAHSFFPGQTAGTLFAMAGDDLSLHFDLDRLTPKQRADHEANEVLTALLQVALLGIGGPRDYVALFDAFDQPPWRALLSRFRAGFERAGLDPVPREHCPFHPRAGFYGSVAAALPDVDLVTLYMLSGSNAVLHENAAALAVSRNLNSKLHFARHAPRAGIPVPETLVTHKAELTGPAPAAFIAARPEGVMLKTLGLAGARNVTVVDGVPQALDYLAEYPDDMPVLLQTRLDHHEWQEMTADLRISDDAIGIANVREILFADGLWVGNRIGSNVALTEAHERVLLRVGEYVREQGYRCPLALNCGVDYFVRGDEVLVTEINARWTGGLFPAELLARLGGTERGAIAFFDQVDLERLDDFMAFNEAYLAGTFEGPFATFPMGFSPYPARDAGRSLCWVWQMVIGDFEAFKARKFRELAGHILLTSERIDVKP